MTVRLATSTLDRWDPIDGERRWLDYSCQEVAGELLVYLHTFRRVRDRYDAEHDLLMWKPSTTALARRYAADEWREVVRAERQWPPAEVQRVPRRPRRTP
jgi:hypothetical protein